MSQRGITGPRGMFNNKVTPVAIGALVVILVVIGAFSTRTSAVDPRVTLRQELAPDGGRPAPDLRMARLVATMEGEVAHMADRLGEATSLALSSGVYLAGAGVNGRLPRDVQALVAGLAQSGLAPPGLVAAESTGTFVTARGSLSVRYRPKPLGVEVISIAAKPDYGPALIVRLPDEVSDKGEARLFVADRLQGVTVPAPFAPDAEVIALGWSPERLRSLK